MGTPSHDELADAGVDEPIEEPATPTASTQPADPLFAPLSELFADPVSGPMIHPLLNTEAVSTPPGEPASTGVSDDEVDGPAPDDSPRVAVETEPEPAGEPEPEPQPEPLAGDIDTTGFSPSAPLDVFAALRQAAPAQPEAEGMRTRFTSRLQRKRRRPPAPTTPETVEKPPPPEPVTPEPVTREPLESQPVTPGPAATRAVADSTSPQITDAAVIGPALAAVLRAEEDAPPRRAPKPAITRGKPTEPTTYDAGPAAASTPEAPADRTPTPTPVAQEPQPPQEPEPRKTMKFESLEELLNAATSRTHPPAPLKPYVEEPVHGHPPASSPAPDPEPPHRADAAQHAAPSPNVAEPQRTESSTAAQPAPQQPSRPAPVSTAVATGSGTETASDLAAPPSHETIDLSARRSTQQVLLALLVVGGAATLALAWLAWQERSVGSVVTALAAAAVTLVLWSAHSNAAPATVVVERGQLDIRSQDSHHRFDLAGAHANIEVEGSPGHRGWKVLIHRTGMPPYKLDAGMVDPQAFTDVLERYRGRG